MMADCGPFSSFKEGAGRPKQLGVGLVGLKPIMHGPWSTLFSLLVVLHGPWTRPQKWQNGENRPCISAVSDGDTAVMWLLLNLKIKYWSVKPIH